MNFKEIKPQDAWRILKEDKNSILIDVRTSEELSFVGYADLSSINRKSVALPWRIYPNMVLNSDFVSNLTDFISESFKQDPLKIALLFLCRTGGRSKEAAKSMAEIGYNCYNIINGFEGDVDDFGHRGTVNGWKAENLPWRQN